MPPTGPDNPGQPGRPSAEQPTVDLPPSAVSAAALGPDAGFELPPPSGASRAPTRKGPADEDVARPDEVLKDRYRIVCRIGGGGMGVVYRGEDLKLANRPVAVKFIRKSLFDAREFELFRAEMATLAGLEAVPGVLKIIDVDLDDPVRPFLVTQFVAGWDLADFARDRVPSLGEMVQIVADVCDTLQAVHDEGVVHRDVKPRNILVRDRQIGGRWVPVIVDFGVALARRGQRQGAATQGGTLQFMSPEHCKGPDHTTRQSDVFSLGVVLYWLLTRGQYPYDLDAAQMLSALRSGTQVEPRPLPPEGRDAMGQLTGVPLALAQVVAKAVAFDPAQRFRSAADFGSALRRWLDAAGGLAGIGGAGAVQAPSAVASPSGTLPLSAPVAPATTSFISQWAAPASRDRASLATAPAAHPAPQPGQAVPELVVPHLSFERLFAEARAMAGATVGPWRIVRFLGLGATALTFRALGPDDKHAVRLRILYPPAPAAGRNAVADADELAVWEALDRAAGRAAFIERTLAEPIAAASGSPDDAAAAAAAVVAAPADYGPLRLADCRTFFAVQDHVAGQEMLESAAREELAPRYGGITAHQIEAAFELVRALDAAHRLALPAGLASSDFGPFHGRIVSGNVIVRGRARPVILDWGMAALAHLLRCPDPLRTPRVDLPASLVPSAGRSAASPSGAVAPGAPREGDDERAALVLQWAARREIIALGQLLRSFFFVYSNDSARVHTFESPAAAWADGLALLQDLRRALREAAPKGPPACRARAADLLRPHGIDAAPGPLVAQLLRFLVADLLRAANPATPAAAALPDLRAVAVRLAEAAALGPGATAPMLAVMADEDRASYSPS